MRYKPSVLVTVLLSVSLLSGAAYAGSCLEDEASFNMGAKLGREQDPAGAIKMFTSFIASNKDRLADTACRENIAINLAAAYYNRGNAYLLKNEEEKAESDFTEAIKLNSHAPSYYYYRGLAYAKDKDLGPADRKQKQMADLAAAVKLDPKYGLKAVYMLGHDLATYQVIPEYPDEAADIQKIIDAGMDINLTDDDGRSSLMYVAGWGHAETLKYLLAKGASPNRADNYGSTALIYAISERRNNAVPILEPHAVSEKEYRALASYYLRRNDLRKASAAIDRALLMNGENPDNHFLKGEIYMAGKDYDNAISAFLKTVALSPNHKQALYKLSLCYGQKAMEAAPDDYLLAGNQANLYLKSGDTEKAVDLYDKALEAALAGIATEKSPQKFQSASWYALFLSRFVDAEKYVKKGLEINPQAADLRSNLGHAYLFLGKKNEALAEYRKYIEQDPNKSVSFFIDLLSKDFIMLKLRYPEKKALVEWAEGQLYIKN